MKYVYIHGLGQMPDSWNRTISETKREGESICPDLAALVQGREVNYKNLYKVFSDICNEMEEPLALCGLSLGGVMALNYAIDYPKKVDSLVLIAAQYRMPKRLLQFQNLIFRFMPKSMFLEMGFGKAEFLSLCKTMMELDFSDSLQKISCPTMVIYGEKDDANKRASVELADKLKHAELRMIPGAGHEVNVDAPEALAEVIREFYEKRCWGICVY